MKLIDSHCHLDLLCEETDLDRILNEANNVNVVGFIVPGLAGEIKLSLKYQSSIWLAWGIHPINAKQISLNSEAISQKQIEQLSYTPIAIGECGLDRSLSIELPKQIVLFERQVHLANECKIPLLIHLVGYWNEAMQILKKAKVPIILHSFTGSKEIARQFLSLGCFISFSGAICRQGFKNAKESAKITPLNRLFIETDSPDMHPDIAIKRHNLPSSLPIILNKLSQIKNVEKSILVKNISNNFQIVFPEIYNTIYPEKK